MRTAIVHDWLVGYAGGERVLEQMLELYPGADLFSVVDFLPDDQRGFLRGKRARTTFIQKLPFARTRYRGYLPLMPVAMEQLDLDGYDLVISSSHAVAKGVLTSSSQTHVCYCYTPIRYAWDLQNQYLAEAGRDRGVSGMLARAMLHYIRMWDMSTINRPDHYIAISDYIARRIKKTYGKDSSVIYPPVDTEFFTPGGQRDDFYLTASRLVPYKKVSLIVEAFAKMPDRRLVVIGDGPQMAHVRARASKNVVLLGHQSGEAMRQHMRRARAFVYAAEEDFGIVVLEAQACGTPVLAYGRGGAIETVKSGETGLFFKSQSVEDIIECVERFETGSFDPAAIRANAERFSNAKFRQELGAFVENAMKGGSTL